MARKFTENPSLDMTPMIDVVFELIIFFVVTLKMAVEKDETIQLEDGRHGIELTADELPPSHLVIDIAKNGRISMCNVTITPDVGRQVPHSHPRRLPRQAQAREGRDGRLHDRRNVEALVRGGL